MKLQRYNPRSPARRHQRRLIISNTKSLTYNKTFIKSKGGRNNTGRKTVRSKGHGIKVSYPVIVHNYRYLAPGHIQTFIVHPHLYKIFAVIKFINNSIGLIPAVQHMYHGMAFTPHKYHSRGTFQQLKHIKPGTTICNIELYTNHGAQLATAPGTCAKLLKSRVPNNMRIRLPSMKTINLESTRFAQIGKNSGQHKQRRIYGYAGSRYYRKRHPHVRGVAMNPRGHPHGGTSGPGRSSVTPGGKPTK